MAKVVELTVQGNVESLLQKELTRVVDEIYEDHGVMIESIAFEWVKMADDKGKIFSCKTQSNYYT
tara:strand:- start:388 stop:582 length:195 start_codon:yes stop_codon:yes gene_type:complete